MTPGVTSLREADFTPCHYVSEGSWSGAKGTTWVIIEPLVEVARYWKDIICGSDDKAESFRFHAP